MFINLVMDACKFEGGFSGDLVMVFVTDLVMEFSGFGDECMFS